MCVRVPCVCESVRCTLFVYNVLTSRSRSRSVCNRYVNCRLFLFFVFVHRTALKCVRAARHIDTKHSFIVRFSCSIRFISQLYRPLLPTIIYCHTHLIVFHCMLVVHNCRSTLHLNHSLSSENDHSKNCPHHHYPYHFVNWKTPSSIEQALFRHITKYECK